MQYNFTNSIKSNQIIKMKHAKKYNPCHDKCKIDGEYSHLYKLDQDQHYLFSKHGKICFAII